MNDLQPEIGRLNVPAKSSGLGGAIFVFLFGLPFAAFGVGALVLGIRKIIEGSYKDGGMISFFGLIFSSVGFGIMAAAILGWKKLNRDAAINERYPGRPWMVRNDWAAGKIKPAATAPLAAYLIWSFLALAVTAPVLFQIPQALHKGEPGILIALIFPVVACALLGYAFVSWRASRRFGDCYFEPAQTPTPLGGVLEGMIQTGKRVNLEHELRLTFSCIRRVVSGSGKERHVSEIPLWQDEKVYRADIVLPEPEPGHSGIPVHFKLPADQPECYSQGSESVFWRLEVRTKMRGLGFHTAFDVPVYKIDGAAIAEPDDTAANETDPTASLQAPMAEVMRGEHSRIRINDGPNGREFYFPPARNLGACFMVTLMMLLFGGIGVLTYHAHAPIVFPIGFGFFGLLLAWFAFSAWFKSSRVTIDTSGVRATEHWLLLRHSRQFSAGEVERFDLASGTTSGTRTFWNIKLIKRGESTFQENKARFQQTGQVPPLRWPPISVGGVTVASDITDRAEADWITGEMTKALGRH